MKVLFCEASQRLENGEILRVDKLWLTSLTLPYLAALVPDDVEVEITNELLEEIDFDGDYDLVGITAKGQNILRAIEISHEFKKRGKTVVMGGVTVTNNPEFVIDHCDSLVIGEAEPVLDELLNDFKNGRLKKVYKADEFCDLNKIPTPRYDLLDKRKCGPIMPVQASRGCPQLCSYCSMVPIFKGKFRIRKVEDVIADVMAIKEMGYKRFYFVDDNLTANKRYAKELLRALIPLKMKWSSQVSLAALNNDALLDIMSESGCEMLSIGFETINRDALINNKKKSNSVDNYKNIIRKLKARGIHVNAFLMFGFDEDDKTIFDATYDFFMDAGVALPELFILVPAPGTTLYQKFQREGRLIHTDWTRYTANEAVYKPKNMTPQELEEGFWKTYDRFYSFRSMFTRLFLKGPRGLFLNILMLGLNMRYKKMITARKRAFF